MLSIVRSGASIGTKCPIPGSSESSCSGNVSPRRSAQAAGMTGSSSPQVITVGWRIRVSPEVGAACACLPAARAREAVRERELEAIVETYARPG